MKDLIEQIRAAFDSVEYPGADNFTNSTGEEAEALIADFRDRNDWKALDPDFLSQAPDGWGSALSFFSAAALQFYLPAYLIADLEGALETSDPGSRLCAFVTPMMEKKKLAKFHGGGTLGEHARKEFEIFSAEQVRVIVRYLWWKLENEGYNPVVEQALENYWLEREAALSRPR